MLAARPADSIERASDSQAPRIGCSSASTSRAIDSARCTATRASVVRPISNSIAPRFASVAAIFGAARAGVEVDRLSITRLRLAVAALPRERVAEPAEIPAEEQAVAGRSPRQRHRRARVPLARREVALGAREPGEVVQVRGGRGLAVRPADRVRALVARGRVAVAPPAPVNP